jgi:hypothetical protein
MLMLVIVIVLVLVLVIVIEEGARRSITSTITIGRADCELKGHLVALL